jgi:ketosteroid isomerase-like protein
MTQSVRDWLLQWERAIQERDFEAGAALFSEDASGFGTVTEKTSTRADLVERQWRVVWPRTRGFSFDSKNVAVHAAEDGTMALAHASWTSLGFDDNGTPRKRTGRCTIVLTRPHEEADWRCVHTHFSMWPQAADIALLKSA